MKENHEVFISDKNMALKISEKRYWQYALWLAIFTVIYNFVEGLVSIYFGVQDETITLFGFGVDSFIEVMSGIGILVMVIRIRRNIGSSRSRFERHALFVTGISFFLLAIGLGATAVSNLFTAHKPETTFPGLIISMVSIVMMAGVVMCKRKVGHALHSSPILADANCTMVCIYMSIVLLLSSLFFQLFGFGLIDSLGAFGLIYFSIKEGKEAFAKAKGINNNCCGDKSYQN